jgi:hypothetical protein
MRCSYTYGDGAQCTARVEMGQKMCHSHVLLTQMAKDKRIYYEKNKDRLNEQRRERRKKNRKPKPEKKIVKEKTNVIQLHDHTAPWRCQLLGCEICMYKPYIEDYIKEVKKRRD